jgi:valyl-tRNA synthetase
MDKTYDPKQIEAKWFARWGERGLFHGDAARGGEPYSVVIPPPNVTGVLHMGHALNNTIQDILVRWRRMQGRNVVWMPGTDHAGIATQNVVERALAKEGIRRHDLGREAFVDRVWEWKREYGSTIVGQLKRLGCSCDWPRERFTLDEGLSDAVAEVFVRLYDKGLIHRANYIVNWCPRCQTALSDEESEHQPTQGKLYYIRYPVAGADGRPSGDSVTVATTRPETLLGDVAVAVNPKDERFRALHGRKLLLPILNRELAVIADDFVDPAFGTGAVKVTPAHDPNDFEMGRRHGLTPVNVMNGDGTMNEAAGPYRGLDRAECRKRILHDLEAAGLLEKVAPHEHAVGHCYRCHTSVEPRLSPQWFVRMKPLAAPAIEAVRSGRVVFVPDRWTKVYLEWMENIRDWCISRQIWWGHRIPIFYCDACGHQWAAKGRPPACPKCAAAGIRQDEDVLDTWFSSWLWPFSTFGWPTQNPDLKFYYPTHDLATASEIIFFWVARMIVAGLEFMGDVPFRTVYIHGTVRDDQGRKMSKSLGNSIDPLTVIDQFSADALRMSLIMVTATGQDVYLSNDKFEIGRNFGTKLWNAARYLEMQGPRPPAPVHPAGLPIADPAALSPDDKHILARLHQAIRDCEDALGKYRFNDAALAIYDFAWRQYCDWYVEYSKPALQSGDPARKATVLAIMHHVFETVLRLLHPFMPFITEELWHAMGYGADDRFVMTESWPRALDASALAAAGVDRETVQYVEDKHELVKAGRALKSDYDIPPSQPVDYIVKPLTADTAARLAADADSLKASLRARSVRVDRDFAPGRATPGTPTALGIVHVPLEGLIDVAAERERLTKHLNKAQDDLARASAKLANESFVRNAPERIVNGHRDQERELRAKVGRFKSLLAALGDDA